MVAHCFCSSLLVAFRGFHSCSHFMVVLQIPKTQSPLWVFILAPSLHFPHSRQVQVFSILCDFQPKANSTGFAGMLLPEGCALEVRKVCWRSGVLWLIARDSCLFWKPAARSCLLTASQKASVCTWISLRLGTGLFWAWVFAVSLPNLICSWLETPVNSVSVCHNQCLFFSLASQASALASSEPVPGSSWLWGMLSLRVNSAISELLFALLLNQV